MQAEEQTRRRERDVKGREGGVSEGDAPQPTLKDLGTVVQLPQRDPGPKTRRKRTVMYDQLNSNF